MSQTKAQLISDLVQALAFTATASAPTNGIFLSATNELAISTNSTQRLTVDSSGNVGIGTSSPSGLFDARGFSYISGVQIRDSSHVAKGYVQGDSRGFLLATDGSTNIAFDVNGTERMRIDSSGRLLVGVTSTVSVAGSSSFIQHHGNKTTCNLALVGYANNLGGPILSFGASRSTTVGTPGTVVSSGDILGDIRFAGDDGTDINTSAAAIRGEVDGTPGSNDMPGRLVFTTTADGASSPTERLRIDSSGNVLVGTTDSTIYNNGDSDSEGIVLRDGEVVDIARKGDLQLTLNRQTNDGYHIGFFRSGSPKAYIATRNDGFCIDVNSSERLRIDSSGNVGIGTTSAGRNLVVNGGSSEGVLQITNNTSGTGVANGLEILCFTSGEAQFLNRENAAMRFDTNNTERMRIDSSGRVGIGTTSPSAPLAFGKTDYGEPSSEDFYRIKFKDNGGIENDVGIGMPNANSLGFNSVSNGSIRFYTGTDGESMRIDDSGHVGIGETNPVKPLVIKDGDAEMALKVTSNTQSSYYSFDNSSGSTKGYIGYNFSSNFMRFSANGGERMRIDSSGSLLVGRTAAYNSSPGEVACFQGSKHGVVIFQAANANYTCLNLRNTYANNGGNNVSGNMITFHDQGGTERGKIAIDGSTTSYITSSDYRLKENVIDINDGITRVKQLQPRRFNFIVDADTTVDGFLAHEAQTVVPEAVTGTHNEVDDDGNAVMQGIDQSKLVPLLTAALQEAIGKIETLETKVAALEAE